MMTSSITVRVESGLLMCGEKETVISLSIYFYPICRHLRRIGLGGFSADALSGRFIDAGRDFEQTLREADAILAENRLTLRMLR